MVQGRVVAQLQRVVALDPVGLADRGEDLGLLDRVDPEVGLEVEVHVEQVGRIAGLLGDDRQHPLLDAAGRGGAAAGSGGRARAPARTAGARRRGAGALVDEGDDVVQGRVVAQLQRVVALDPVGLADRGEDLGLLDRVDPEVGLEVEVHVEQVGRVAGLLGDDRQDPLLDAAVRRGAAARSGLGAPRQRGRLGSGRRRHGRLRRPARRRIAR